MSERRDLLTRWASEQRPTKLLGLVRLLLAGLILKNSFRLLRELDREGYFAEQFFIPVLPDSWVPPVELYQLLVGLKAVAAGLAILGVLPRASLFTAATVGLYIIACDRLHYHNNHYATHLLALLLSWAPCGDGFNLLDTLRRRQRPPLGPYWAVRLTQLQVSCVYLASGVGKLLDADWRGGRAMSQRFSKAAHGLPEPLGEILRSPWFGELASKAAIFTELFVALGLWFPRTRASALWLGIVFHVGIQLSARVDLFSYLMLSTYVLFVTPELHERVLRTDPSHTRGRVVARAVRLLDWFQRFRHEPGSTAELGGAFTVIDRDGRAASRFAGFVALCRALPLLFPLWLPLRIAQLAGEGRALGAPATREKPLETNS